MYRGVAAVFALLIVAGLGGQARDYAGVDRVEAERVAVRVARAMRAPALFADFRERRPHVLIGTFASRAGSSPGTCGFAGFVLDEATERVVPGATISVSPSTPWSGISPGPSGVVETAVADDLGGFVLLDFPFEPLGYDVTIDATAYATSRIVHQGCYEGYAIGDWVVARRPRFEDATPVPVRR